MSGRRVFTVVLFYMLILNIFLFYQDEVEAQEVDYILIVAVPGNGSSEIPDMTVDVETTITGYAASFNSTTGYMGDVVVDWSVFNMSGAEAYTNPTSGSSSDFHSGPKGGTAIWTAAYYHNGTWYNDTVIFNINPPTTDYIRIVDSPGKGSTEIPDHIVGVGQTRTGYAAAFNFTVGYIGDISVSWNVTNSGGSNGSTSPPSGDSSTFHSGHYGGTANWTANDGSGHFDTVIFTIFPPTQDWIDIVDTPNTGANEIIDQSVVIDTTIWGYAAGFNNSIGYFDDISVDWTVINTGGATASTFPDIGTGSLFDAGPDSGQATWKAVDGVSGLNDIISFNISNIGVDWIWIEDAPGGGGNVIPDQTVESGTSVTGYATAYNFTAGYIGSTSVSWSVNNVGSNASTNPGSGIHSVFHSGNKGGTATWIADGGGPSDSVSFTITSATIDYITLTNAPNGTALGTVTLPFGGQVTAYASGYNTTSGYVDLVEVDWVGGGGTWNPGTGTSSTFTAGNNTGTFTQTGENTTLGMNDTFDVEILQPTVDYIILTDSPDGTELLTETLNPGEQVTIYASGYNTTSGYIGLITVAWAETGGLGSFSNLTGSSTIFTAGASPGQTTIIGDVGGMNDTFDVIINSPPFDYILLTDQPNGSAFTTVILNIGEQVTAYASGYNITSGYVGLVHVNWSQGPVTLGSFDNLTGTSTTFTAGFVGGSTTVTGQNLHLGVSDIFTININPPTVDYITLTDSANGLALTTVTLSTGEQVTAYASSYNATSGFMGLLDVNWSQVPLLGLFDNLTGTSTTFTAGGTGGLTTVTGENLTLGVGDTFEINVINATVDYIQIRNAPSGGGLVISNLILSVGQSYSLWASAYNHSSGYLGDFMSTVWTETSGGTIITVSSPGASTDVQAQLMGGSSVIIANYSSIQNTTGVTVNPPTVDYILLTDSPDGTGFSTVILPVGGKVTAYASGYNNTSGYVGLVEVDWSQVPTLGSFDNNTGTSTTFTAGSSGGLTTITGSNTTLAVGDTFEVDITAPTLDYVLLTETPNGTVLVTVTLNVGESVTAYSSGYNSTGAYVDLVEVNWSESSGLGSFKSLLGTSTTFTAGLLGGSTTVKGENATLGLNDTFDVNITPPTADFVQIRTQPAGGGIDLCDPANYKSYPVGGMDIYYGAMYNSTAGYISDVTGNADWSSSNTILVTVTSPGSYSNITCDDREWGGPVTITLTASGEVNTTRVTVLQPTVDYILLRDENGGLGEVVTDRTYIVWQVDTFYAAGYNNTADYLGEVEAAWSINDTAVGHVTSPGLWTNFTAQEVDNDSPCHVTAEFNGVTDTTGTLTVLAPRIDFITILDAPNGGGNWIASRTYDEGESDVFWAAGYNLTADYVTDVEATWNSNNTVIGKVTPGPSEYTDFTAGWRGGYCYIAATYGILSNLTGPLFVINVNQMPTARADYYNGTGFSGGSYSFGTDITLRVTGRKKNTVTMQLEEDGHVVEEVAVTRHSNQPDIGRISHQMDVHHSYEVVLRYDGNNGGSNPVIVTFEFLGNIYSVHLLFNSQHGEDQVARIRFNDITQLVGTVFFDGYRSTDFEGYIVDYTWDFGDGATGTGQTLAHTYEENGVYSVTLTVTDDEGGTDTDTVTVTMENIDNNDQVNAILGSNASQGYLNGSGQYVVILQCPADLMINNNEGGKIGLFQGSPVNTLDNSYPAMRYSDIEVYYIQGDETYTLKVTGTGTGYYDLAILGVENDLLKSISFTNVPCTENTLDTYVIDFAEGRITLLTNEEDKLYSLSLMVIEGDYEDEFTLTDMLLVGEEKHTYVIQDWETLSVGKPVTLFIDEDGDGAFDREIDLESGLTGDEVDILFLRTPVAEPIFPLTLFIVAGIICAIGVGTLLTELGKWTVLTLFLPMYTRIKKEELLDQPTRYKIYGYIIGNPGAYFGLIKQDLELGSGQLVYHLKQLENADMIYSREDGVKRRFYPAHVAKPRGNPYQLSDIQEKILGIIKNNSGIDQKKIASSVGISRQVAGYHLTIMERKGMIDKKNAGRRNRYYPIDEIGV